MDEAVQDGSSIDLGRMVQLEDAMSEYKLRTFKPKSGASSVETWWYRHEGPHNKPVPIRSDNLKPVCLPVGLENLVCTAIQKIPDYDEDKRIEMIGHRAMDHKERVGIVTDSEEGKADRYIKKLQERFPGIRILERGNGPVEDSVFVKVGPPEN